MTLTTLLITFSIIGLVLTLVTKYFLKQGNSIPMTFLQYFCGVWYLFSGLVKAIDPMGTAFKMKEYFGEFSRHFKGTWLGFLDSVWPVLGDHAIWFSIFMIVLEVILGIALIIGYRRLGTAWVFLLLLLFFTKLTGFTYLTGYVPEGAHFMDFDKWAAYKSTNMKVTDCGCFGDFLKLEPKVSFFKDLFLLIPAFLFVFAWKKKHELFSSGVRSKIVGLAGILTIAFCYYNTFMNEPVVDFRPFGAGVNVRDVKKAELEAAADIKVIGYKLTSKTDGKVVEMPMDQFMKEYKNYPSEQWSYDQVKTEPRISATKISNYRIETEDGQEISDRLLEEPGYSLMLVMFEMLGDESVQNIEVVDSVWVVDPVKKEAGSPDSLTQRLVKSQKSETVYAWDENYTDIIKNKILPLMMANSSSGVNLYGIAGGAFTLKINAFKKAIGINFPIYMQDDLVVKTIMRSNPGLVLWHNGSIVKKWHHNALPTIDELKALIKK